MKLSVKCCREISGGHVQSKQGEGEQRLVNPADHDTGVFLPVLNIAVMSQSRAHVPSQETPAHDPEKGKEAVDGDVEVWFQTDAAVQDYGDAERGDREEGR